MSPSTSRWSFRPASATRGKTRSVKGHAGVYDILYVYDSETGGRLAGRLALDIMHSLLPRELQGLEGLDLIAPAPRALDIDTRRPSGQPRPVEAGPSRGG